MLNIKKKKGERESRDQVHGIITNREREYLERVHDINRKKIKVTLGHSGMIICCCVTLGTHKRLNKNITHKHNTIFYYTKESYELVVLLNTMWKMWKIQLNCSSQLMGI